MSQKFIGVRQNGLRFYIRLLVSDKQRTIPVTIASRGEGYAAECYDAALIYLRPFSSYRAKFNMPAVYSHATRMRELDFGAEDTQIDLDFEKRLIFIRAQEIEAWERANPGLRWGDHEKEVLAKWQADRAKFEAGGGQTNEELRRAVNRLERALKIVGPLLSGDTIPEVQLSMLTPLAREVYIEQMLKTSKLYGR